jgi:hypothetical protein
VVQCIVDGKICNRARDTDVLGLSGNTKIILTIDGNIVVTGLLISVLAMESYFTIRFPLTHILFNVRVLDNSLVTVTPINDNIVVVLSDCGSDTEVFFFIGICSCYFKLGDIRLKKSFFN